MSSIHFPILVGRNESERIVIIHLVDNEENYVDYRVIITESAGKDTPLFRIPEDAKFIDINGNLREIDWKNHSLQITTGGINLEPRLYDGYYEYRVNQSVFDDVIELSTKIKLENGEVDMKGSLHIARPKENESVFRINADLGSDATQVNYFDLAGRVGIQEFNLIERLKGLYKSRKYSDLDAPEKGEPLFLQMEKGNINFFKTGNITIQDKGDITKDVNQKDTFINYLNVSAAGKNKSTNISKRIDTWAHETPFSEKLINIKMLYAHYNLPEVISSIANIQFSDKTGINYNITNQGNLLRVLFTIYKTIITCVLSDPAATKCKYFSVLLLVPNIYVQQNIDDLLYELNELNKDHPEKRFDFRVVSESDSAFVGVKEARMGNTEETILGTLLSKVHNPRQKDVFLIIDAGKGTTDYSIIRFDSDCSGQANNDMVSVQRGGIVGAGGAIDYVFARVFARQVFNHVTELGVSTVDVGEAVFVSRFMKMIENLPPVDQDRMMLIVETLKKSYSYDVQFQQYVTANAYCCFEKDEAKKIIMQLAKKDEPKYDEISTNYEDGWEQVSEWIWDEVTYVTVDSQDKKEVDWVCKAIADTIVNDMIFTKYNEKLTQQIDYVIFNGRSFLFSPLKDAFLNAIKTQRGVFSVNMFLPISIMPLLYKVKKMKPLNKINWEQHENLKEALLKGFDMKKISVGFTNHNLGINCNSNLCCMDLLSTSVEEVFDISQFWMGFPKANSEKRYFYIGYKASSFAPRLNQIPGVAMISEDRRKLICMTMFPVKWHSINFANSARWVVTAPTGASKAASSGSNSSSENQTSPKIDVTDSASPQENLDDANLIL